MYEVIVLGATFAAAGIAQQYKEKCLILEPSLQAGNEFFGALHFGLTCKNRPQNSEAQELWERFSNNIIYENCREIYPYLQQVNVLFDVQLVSVQQTEQGFECVTYGVEGFNTHQAKRVIDTRSSEKVSSAKTFNLLIESKEAPAFPGIFWEATGIQDYYVLRLPIPLSYGYPEARAAAKKVIAEFAETQKLILSASVFDYQIMADYPKMIEGVRYLPSKAYDHPALAFEAGLEVTL